MFDLIGKRILKLFIGKGEYLLAFETDSGTILYTTEGDCCSESWFADIIGVKTLLGEIVTSAEEVPLPDYNVEDGRGRQEYDEAYGWRLTTRKGVVDIIYRNSSNGYYGGWMERAYVEMPDNMLEISDDWSA